ncbi:baseplate J/gp47 family protein [Clostridium sp. YIM B02555]|uniref:baseplate J/gp47 family protein n=1 Tax=Clostridium sp. YIM B02555 TaxID=2911968 RepID=UPI001EED115F|nr:baseplate J/gp47 family protein [Clostridium sp. YIM B02555]
MATNITLPDYITKTSEEIHKEMLDNAPDNINTIEGDVFWNATKPMADESARIRNIALKKILYSRFPQTATDGDLVEIGESKGIYKKSADYAIHKMKFVGEEGRVISAGRIVSTESTEITAAIQFMINETVVIPANGEVTVNATCTVAGTIGNVALGGIKLLLKSLNGIASLENIEIVKYGVDIEDDESYRERLLEEMQRPNASGNKYQYEQWAKEVTGVGEAKCVPGAGSVKIIITDSNNKAATEELIQEVYNHIDKARPILAGTLTVVSAVEKAIKITAKIVLDEGYTLEKIRDNFEILVNEYLKTIKFKSSDNNISYVSIAKIGNLILNILGVLDYSELRINDGTSNITLEDQEIATLDADAINFEVI